MKRKEKANKDMKKKCTKATKWRPDNELTLLVWETF